MDQYDYAYQRLTDATAKKFLVGRTAEEVAEVILDAPRRAGKQIKWLKAYIEASLAGIDSKKQQQSEDEPIITDELRDLVRLAGEQKRAKRRVQPSQGN